jgi:hypothetical protein
MKTFINKLLNLFSKKQSESKIEPKSESIIGRYYLPFDNSYSVNITSCSNYPYENKHMYLAGTASSNNILCKVVSEPFMCKVKSLAINNKISDILMIIVEHNNEHITVMYKESQLK